MQMDQNFKGNHSKDIEAASETIISSSSFTGNINNMHLKGPKPSITSQQIAGESFDNFIEKRNRRE